jgi:hypothetical protein
MLTNFRDEFATRYQDILNKRLVGMKIASFRFEPNLKSGDVLHRFKLDLSNVLVRDIVNLTDRTVDPISDSDQTLTIDRKKGTTFPIAHWEEVQAGELNPGMTAGKEVARKVATYVDADILFETKNAFATFDTGNLTGANPNGTPIAMAVNNVAQIITQSWARLDSNDAPMVNTAWVVDPYFVSILAQHPLGKDTQLGDQTFRNGFSGNTYGSEIYVSNNLTGEAVLNISESVTDEDTVVIEGVTFNLVTSLGAVAGNVLIGANAAATRANLISAINGTAGAGSTYVALSAADRIKITNRKRITASETGTTVVLVGVGSGRLNLSETLTHSDNEFTKNFVHCYFGQKGSIEVIMQNEVNMKMRPEPKQDTMNIFNDVLYGIKTFDDGAEYFLDVHIAA